MTKKKSWEDSPMDDNERWPARLNAYTVSNHPTRIMGYELIADLACHYTFPEVVLLMLTGELPNEQNGQLFHLTMMWMTPVSIAESPAHATLLARLTGANTAGLFGVASLALAEKARSISKTTASFLEWLRCPKGPPPKECLSDDQAECSDIDQIRNQIESQGLRVPEAIRNPQLNRDAFFTALLFQCGLTSPMQIETARVLAALPCVLSEALFATPGDLNSYPINLPPVRYEEQE